MSPEQAKTMFNLDPATGALTWKIRSARCIWEGDVAGSIKADGYIVVSYKRKGYPAHHIVWALTHGAWPEDQLDHINGNRADNRPENLRPANAMLNNQNKRRASRNNLSSGMLGVHFYARTGRWRATIHTGGKNRYLGYFTTAADAQAAYLEAKRKFHNGCTI